MRGFPACSESNFAFQRGYSCLLFWEQHLYLTFSEISLLTYSRNNFILLFQRSPSLFIPEKTSLCFFRDAPPYLFQEQLLSFACSEILLTCSRNNSSPLLFQRSPCLLVPGTTSLSSSLCVPGTIALLRFFRPFPPYLFPGTTPLSFFQPDPIPGR